jgi:7-cyano-7-deazaguanine synthase
MQVTPSSHFHSTWSFNLMQNHALVLFSGGQDSTVCVAWALQHYDKVHTIGFSYDQRHGVEIGQRPIILDDLRSKFPEWEERLGDDKLVHISLFRSIVDSALLAGTKPQGTRADGLPATFVPGRNLVFLLTAGIIAKERGIRTLVGGMCETDFSGYPDCRNDTIRSMETTLNLGLQANIVLETPLMWIDKAETWKKAHDLGGTPLVNTIVNHTHTCYENNRSKAHAWGLGCGKCAACELRARGWAKYAEGRAWVSSRA